MKKLFRLAVISDEVSQDFDQVIRFAREYELDGIELRSVGGKAFKDLTLGDVASIATAAREAGLAVPSVATPVFKCALDDDSEIARHIDLFRRSVDYARTLGAGIVRVFAFLRQDEPTRKDVLLAAADKFRILLEALEGSGVAIGLENESSTLVCTGGETKVFLAALDRPSVGVVWDPCNVLFVPGRQQPTVDDYGLIADRVIHVHVKDAVRSAERLPTSCCELGTGSLDLPAQIEGLRAHAYTGWISLETHWRMKPLTADEQLLPAGYGFSANAEEPTRICLEHLKKLVSIRQ
jgi:sugar phosphate isomerase/epimerase